MAMSCGKKSAESKRFGGLKPHEAGECGSLESMTFSSNLEPSAALLWAPHFPHLEGRLDTLTSHRSKELSQVSFDPNKVIYSWERMSPLVQSHGHPQA